MARVRGVAGKRHPVITAAWLMAAAVIVVGFLMRVAARYWVGDGLRLLGVSFIAAGVLIALVAWLGERAFGLQPPP